ncbi:MAG: hypothetical protein QM668_08555 [Agriterribacter sp.]
MKKGLLYVLALLLYSCSGPKYFIAVDDLIPQDATTFEMDNSCELYIRQVYRHFNTNENKWELNNEMKNDSDSVVEKEFMIISEKTKKVLIINNIPSIYQNLYEKNKSFEVANLTSEIIEVDTRYFRQFRFGTWNKNFTIFFKSTEDEKSTHTWVFSPDDIENPEVLKLMSVSVGDESGEQVRNTGPAVKIGIVYKRVPDFSIVFNRQDDDGNVIETIPLSDNKIYYKRKCKKWYTYFRFDKPVDGINYRNIYFKKRVYSIFP